MANIDISIKNDIGFSNLVVVLICVAMAHAVSNGLHGLDFERFTLS